MVSSGIWTRNVLTKDQHIRQMAAQQRPLKLISLQDTDVAKIAGRSAHLLGFSLMRQGPSTAAHMGAVKVSTSVSLSGSSDTANR